MAAANYNWFKACCKNPCKYLLNASVDIAAQFTKFG